MGQRKNRNERFLRDHRWCCFCGGSTLSTTIDHVPPRTCFYGRAGPDGFEFPACFDCQTATRQAELALGFYARFLDFSEENYSSDEGRKLIQGMNNNLPHLLPRTDIGGSIKRRAMRQVGLQRPPGTFLSDMPLIHISAKVRPYFEAYARKLACALFYRERARIAPSDYWIWSSWTAQGMPTQVDSLHSFIEMTPYVRVGSRKNLSFGDRFSYRYNCGDSPDMMATLAQFGKGVILASIVVDPSAYASIPNPTRWVKLRNAFSEIVELHRQN